MRRAALLFSVVGGVAFGGCLSATDGVDDLEVQAVFAARGEFVGPAFEGEAATIRHEAIPGYMDAMRMSLRVAEPAEIAGLRPGQKIAFEIAQTEDGDFVRAVRPLPDSTRLDLAP